MSNPQLDKCSSAMSRSGIFNHGVTVYFHVDRSRQLRVGQRVELSSAPTVAPELEHVIAPYRDRGLSRFGSQALLGAPPSDLKLDLFVEEVRLNRHPLRPSRFQVLFGTADLETALRFRSAAEPSGHPAGPAPIFRIEARTAFVTDMELLGAASLGLERIAMTDAYWAGGTHPRRRPLLEALIELPARVVDQIA